MKNEFGYVWLRAKRSACLKIATASHGKRHNILGLVIWAKMDHGGQSRAIQRLHHSSGMTRNGLDSGRDTSVVAGASELSRTEFGTAEERHQKRIQIV